MHWPGLTVFDLDDTLYLERDFVRSGFAAADQWLVRQGGPPGLARTCLALFEAGHRGRIFDEALVRLGIPVDLVLVGQLVEFYRDHDPDIALAPDAARYFADPTRTLPPALITDGPAATQCAKVRALGIEDRFGCIVCTGALGPGRGKPHPEAFARIEAWAEPYGLPLVYIADNPLKDFVAPRSRGWLTIQIARRERVHHVTAPDAAHAAHARIASLDALDACLAALHRSDIAPVGTFPTDAAGRLPIS